MKQAFLALSFLFLPGARADSASPFRVGEPVPRLTLPAISDGASKLSLSDFRGEKVMLHVWASW